MSKTRLERLRRICLALPETTEQVTWDVDLTWRVRDKIFAISGPEAERVTLKATREDQAALVAASDRIAVAPYVGRFGWVSVDLTGRPDWDELAELVAESWRLVAPKKLAAAMQPQPPARSR